MFSFENRFPIRRKNLGEMAVHLEKLENSWKFGSVENGNPVKTLL